MFEYYKALRKSIRNVSNFEKVEKNTLSSESKNGFDEVCNDEFYLKNLSAIENEREFPVTFSYSQTQQKDMNEIKELKSEATDELSLKELNKVEKEVLLIDTVEIDKESDFSM